MYYKEILTYTDTEQEAVKRPYQTYHAEIDQISYFNYFVLVHIWLTQ